MNLGKKDLEYIQKKELVIIKTVKIMLNNTEGRGNNWSLEMGFYPGILLGFRIYEFDDSKLYTLYLPFVDFSLEIY
jgi:hypothetical protein